jgi:hypothetical protein
MASAAASSLLGPRTLAARSTSRLE